MESPLTVGEALTTFEETSHLDFKGSFDTQSLGEWLALIENFVALANSGGGVLFIGVDDDGQPTGTPFTARAALDPAVVVDKVHAFTGVHFSGFRLAPAFEDGMPVFAVEVHAAEIPLVFTEAGSYTVTGRAKSAFAPGTVYFRHGPKSEPGTTDDLRQAIERRIESVRAAWTAGIARVIEAPPGSQVFVLPPEMPLSSDPAAQPFRLDSDPNAPGVVALPIDRTHPNRQRDVRDKVNEALPGRCKITGHDVFCVRRVFAIDSNPSFCFMQRHASPQFSDGFVTWLLQEREKNPAFFAEARHVMTTRRPATPDPAADSHSFASLAADVTV
ncbi:MAG: ATP-binding protein [Thermoanaerobaculia bacterium]